MKLSEMKRLPKKAGLARLQFGSRAIQRNPPYRNHDLIVLPRDLEAQFYPLQNGRQFLLRSPPFFNRTWFGGTDENPFLVELENEAFRAFKKGRQKGFYEALKPEVITAVERRFNVTSKRQGDIWAVPFPSWNDANFAMLLCFEKILEPRAVKSKSIFSTRHRLTGLCAKLDHTVICDRGRYIDADNLTMFATGTVEAPDHSPMKLEGVHVLAQTRYLADPAKAE